MKLNPNKCCFGAQNIPFLGHVVSAKGSRPNPKKIGVMENFPIPKLITNVKAFLGFTSYYTKFILRYAKIAESLFSFTKDGKFIWTPIC